MDREIVKVTKVYGELRTQIPTLICREKGIRDGDSVRWVRINNSGTIIFEPVKTPKAFSPLEL